MTDDTPRPDPADGELTSDEAPGTQEGAPDAAPQATGKTGSAKGESGHNIDAMLNVGLNVQVVLGRTRMPIAQLLKLSRGAIIELDKNIGQPVEVVINDRLVARGDLIKLADERIGVSLTEIVKDYVSDL